MELLTCLVTGCLFFTIITWTTSIILWLSLPFTCTVLCSVTYASCPTCSHLAKHQVSFHSAQAHQWVSSSYSTRFISALYSVDFTRAGENHCVLDTHSCISFVGRLLPSEARQHTRWTAGWALQQLQRRAPSWPVERPGHTRKAPRCIVCVCVCVYLHLHRYNDMYINY